jgi:site-specific recombinase XerD
MNKSDEEAITRTLGFNHLILAGSLDTSTLEVYGRDCHAYLRFAETKEAALSPETLASWIEHLTTTAAHAPSTINRMATAVRRLMWEAGARGSIDQAVAERFQRITGVPTMAFKAARFPAHRQNIEPEMIQQMAGTPALEGLIALRNRALLLTLASSGLRVETCRLLRQEQLTYGTAHSSIAVQRPGETQPRAIPLSQEAAGAVQAWLEARSLPSPYLFTRFEGRSNTHSRLSAHPVSRTAVHTIIRQYGAAIGIPDLKPNDLRRFAGQRFAQQDVHVAQVLLGYKSLATVYHTCFPDEIALEPGITENLY